jgi:osmoprotectant transport system substrate-binding protein
VRLAALLAALLLTLVVGACGGSDDDDAPAASDRPARAAAPDAIRIGVKNFTEQAILGELYRQALEAKGFDVVLKDQVGSTEIIHRALRRGYLDMYPEYVGVLLSEVAHVRARPRGAAGQYAAAKRYERKNGFTMLAQSPLEDSNALAVKPAFAKRHGLRTIADLRRLKGTVKIAALSEFRTRFEGLDGLRDVYGLRNLRVSTRKGVDRYRALDDGDVDVASVFTAEAQLAGKKYLVLDDPHGLFASGHVAPILSDQTLEAHGPRLRTAIDDVSTVLTTAAMREMNAAVDLAGREAAEVAAEFLRAHDLLNAAAGSNAGR